MENDSEDDFDYSSLFADIARDLFTITTAINLSKLREDEGKS